MPTGAAWVKRELLGDYSVSTALSVYTYRWNGATYKLAKAEKTATYRTDSFNPDKSTAGDPCQ